MRKPSWMCLFLHCIRGVFQGLMENRSGYFTKYFLSCFGASSYFDILMDFDILICCQNVWSINLAFYIPKSVINEILWEENLLRRMCFYFFNQSGLQFNHCGNKTGDKVMQLAAGSNLTSHRSISSLHMHKSCSLTLSLCVSLPWGPWDPELVVSSALGQ